MCIRFVLPLPLFMYTIERTKYPSFDMLSHNLPYVSVPRTPLPGKRELEMKKKHPT